MSFPRYAKYRNSGVAWLGDVPAHWDTVALKRVSPSQTVGIVVNPSDYVADEGLPFLYGGDIQEGRIDLDGCRRITQADSNRNPKTKLQAGDLVTVRVGAPGVTAVVPAACEGGNCASVMLIRRGTFDSRWLCYVMNDRVVRYQVEIVQYGAAQEQFNISHAVNFIVPKPSLDEQVAIADHLDNQTAKIDALVKEQRRLIELLKEKLQALISQAVTKGLNSNTTLKDSGVEWLGRVPAHWLVKPIGAACRYISYGFTNPMPSTDDGPHLLTANDVGDGVIQYESSRRTDREAFSNLLTAKSRPEKDDVLLTKDGTLGRVGIHDGRDACINQSVALIRVDPEVLQPTFLLACLHGGIYQDRMLYEAGGTTIKHIYISRFSKMHLGVPPREEQVEISEFFQHQMSKFNGLISTAESAIGLLQERRLALISAAVTGKIDVRGLVPRPEAVVA